MPQIQSDTLDVRDGFSDQGLTVCAEDQSEVAAI